jgi:protein phosphatase
MSFNPFKKKNPAGEAATEGEEAADATATAGTAVPPESDRTDPLADAHVAPAANVLRDGPGGRVEQVSLGGDRFLRLSVSDAARADTLRPLLLTLPEQSTGFRDLLVVEAGAFGAAFDVPETSLANVTDLRSTDILAALTSVASTLTAAAQSGLVWPTTSAEHIGLDAEQTHRAAGFRRYRAMFSAFDQLAPGDEASAARELAALFIPPLDALLNAAQRSGFHYAHSPLAQLLGRLEELAQSASSYAEVAAPFASSPAPQLHAATDTGRRREHNEDAYALLTLEQASVAGARFTLAAVADGMGGHNSGEIASSLALDLLRTHLSQLALAPKTAWVGQTHLSANSPQTRVSAPPGLGGILEQIVPAIGRALNERAALDSGLAGMGTTLAGYAQLAPQTTRRDGAALPAAQGAVFWVGDSRAYLLSATGMTPLSVDHSYVQDLVDQGQVTPDEAFSHPQKNIITRCLGASGRDDRPEVAPFTLGPGELLLLCSDGLTDALRDADVWQVITSADSADLAELATALIDAANAAGGPDNITVAFVAG